MTFRRSRAAQRRLLGCLVLAAAMVVDMRATAVRADEHVDVTVGVLNDAPPFSYQASDGGWQGLAVVLWSKVAEEVHLDSKFVGMTRAEMIDAVADGRARFGIGALAITADRLSRVSFSIPFDDTGVAIVVPYVARSAWDVVRDAVFSATFVKLSLGLLALLVLVGTIFWIAERRHNPDFGGKGMQGWGTGVWLSIVTMTTVGYGDKAPKTLGGRVVAALWMFVSIVLISIFTGTVATLLTLEKLGPRVSGFEDLTRARVACVSGSAACQLLSERRLRAEGYPDLNAALEAVVSQKADALVYDHALLAAALKLHPDLPLRILPGTVRPEYYAFAMRADEPLRHEINVTIARILDRDAWTRVRFDYLGEEAEKH